MIKVALKGFSDDMIQSYRELVDLLIIDGWSKTDILDSIARRIDPTTEFFAELSIVVMDCPITQIVE